MDPKAVQQEKAIATMQAELAVREKVRQKNDDKAKMKGKNRQSKRHRKKQLNVVDDRRFKALVRNVPLRTLP
jgi:U3 small nucleolar RNA-associated protein 7